MEHPIKKTRPYLVQFFTVISLCLSLFANADSLPSKNQRFNVLVLHSGASNVHFEQKLMDGFQYAIKDYNVTLHHHSLRPNRNWKLAGTSNQVSRFQEKLSAIQKLDLIISLDTPSQLFLQQYGKEVLQKSPALFTNTFVKAPSTPPLQNQTYLATNIDLSGNIKLIKDLIPASKKLMIISSHHPWDTQRKEQLLQLSEQLELQLEYLSLADLSYSDFAKSLKRNTTIDSILLLDAQQDNQGNIITFDESVRFINRQTDVPIFYPLQSIYNESVIGGKQISAYQLGLKSGKEAIKLLTDPNQPLQTLLAFSESITTLNKDQLSEHDISLDLIPKHAETTQSNSETGPKKGVLILISALLVLQSFLIAGLQLSRIKTKRAKDSLTEIQHTLEISVKDRTEKLKELNNQLYEEIAKHEITEELLQETQDYLNSILNSMPSILIGVTSHGYITHWNSGAEVNTDITSKEAMGRLINDVFPAIEVTVKDIRTAISENRAKIKENIKQGDGADATYMDVAVYPLVAPEANGAVIRVDDVTMRVRLENMMIQNEKMMSLGELAAGTAHEINNPLAAVLQGVQNFHRRIDTHQAKNIETAEECGTSIEAINHYLKKRSILDFVDGIRDSGERAARIVRNMLEFSHSSQQGHMSVNLNELLNHCLELAKSTFELKSNYDFKHISVETNFDHSLPLVPCSPAEIEQVILNLVKNASYALMEIDAPKIEIITKRTDDYVCIIVGDNGAGMPENVQKHIFEPFFTTKNVGEGTGLGLSVSYFIITEHHGGDIEVESKSNEGTRFVIRLPLTPLDQHA